MSASQRPAARLGPRLAGILRAGTLLAVAVIAAGWTIAMAGGHDGPGARPIGELVEIGGGDGVISLGLLALTLLPFAVLATAASTFASDGERRYLVACLATLALLAGSLAVAALAAPG